MLISGQICLILKVWVFWVAFYLGKEVFLVGYLIELKFSQKPFRS